MKKSCGILNKSVIFLIEDDILVRSNMNTDYQKVYKYRKVTSETSDTQVSNGGEISNVQKWVRYREAR